MTAKNRKLNFYINQELESKVKQNFGTTDVKELELIVKDFLTNGIQNKQDPNLTTKEKLEKVKLANETIKIWKEFKQSGFTVEQLGDFVYSVEQIISN